MSVPVPVGWGHDACDTPRVGFAIPGISCLRETRFSSSAAAGGRMLMQPPPARSSRVRCAWRRRSGGCGDCNLGRAERRFGGRDAHLAADAAVGPSARSVDGSAERACGAGRSAATVGVRASAPSALPSPPRDLGAAQRHLEAGDAKAVLDIADAIISGAETAHLPRTFRASLTRLAQISDAAHVSSRPSACFAGRASGIEDEEVVNAWILRAQALRALGRYRDGYSSLQVRA